MNIRFQPSAQHVENRRDSGRMVLEQLTPLRLRPIFKPAIWGGTRLRPWLGETPSSEPIGEAWILSDYGENHSEILEGSAKGKTIRQLMDRHAERLLGPRYAHLKRFPLLLKFIDAQQPLSVQVHPTDLQAKAVSPDAFGKTEAWVMLETQPGSKLYSGLVPGISTADLRAAIATGHLEPALHVINPKPGDCIFLKAGTVHAIGAGVMLFEIQQSSDITYRLFDWNRRDPKTGLPRELHVDRGLECVNDTFGPVNPCKPITVGGRQQLVSDPYFSLYRWETSRPFRVGHVNECRMLIGLTGNATIQVAGRTYAIRPGDVWLIPAEVGPVDINPQSPLCLLEAELGN